MSHSTECPHGSDLFEPDCNPLAATLTMLLIAMIVSTRFLMLMCYLLPLLFQNLIMLFALSGASLVVASPFVTSGLQRQPPLNFLVMLMPFSLAHTQSFGRQCLLRAIL